jgi:hypothetical protein
MRRDQPLPILATQVESDRGEAGTDGIINPNVELT